MLLCWWTTFIIVILSVSNNCIHTKASNLQALEGRNHKKSWSSWNSFQNNFWKTVHNSQKMMADKYHEKPWSVISFVTKSLVLVYIYATDFVVVMCGWACCHVKKSKRKKSTFFHTISPEGEYQFGMSWPGSYRKYNK